MDDDFKKLKVWSKAHEIALEAFKVTRTFPREEMYGLTSQLRRAAASVGANIAEGCRRRSDGDMSRFLRIARGSATEMEYHLLLARDLGLLDEDRFQAFNRKVDEVQRMLTALINRLEIARKSGISRSTSNAKAAQF
jgi:four helix bundle protein